MGEYSALVAAGSLSLGDAVKLVNLRGKLMQNAVPQGQGAMAAILGLEDAKVLELCEQVNVQGRGSVEAANYNAQGQVVIAGDKTLVEAVMAWPKKMVVKPLLCLYLYLRTVH